MKDFLLFIDTEASGLPKNWSLPYDCAGNWPNCVQISWVIYTKDGLLIKEEDHYIKNEDFELATSATKIHGITKEHLKIHGECRKAILALLCKDVYKYDPLIVGHFMQFDLHLLNADFYREGMDNPIKKNASFCTMRGSAHLIKNPSLKILRLEQLYHLLFHTTLNDHHNAIVDAKATAKCFFELLRRSEIDEKLIEHQQKEVLTKEHTRVKQGCLLPVLVVISLATLIIQIL